MCVRICSIQLTYTTLHMRAQRLVTRTAATLCAPRCPASLAPAHLAPLRTPSSSSRSHRFITTASTDTYEQQQSSSTSSSRMRVGAACAAAMALATTLWVAQAESASDSSVPPSPPPAPLDDAARARLHTITPQYTRTAPFERSKIAELRRHLQEEMLRVQGQGQQGKCEPLMTSEQATYLTSWALHDDWALLRYLRGNSMDVRKACKALVATAQWRMDNRVDQLDVTVLGDSVKDGRLYVSSEPDPHGRSLVVYRKSGEAQKVGTWNPDVHKQATLELVYTLERAIRSMEDRATSGEVDHEIMDYKWSMLVDLGKYTKSSATPWHVTRSLIDVLRFHYPERLHYAVIIEPPTFLRALFWPLRLVMPAVTISKVVFLDDRSSDATLRTMTHIVGSLDRLPFECDIVGARTKFDPEEYVRTDPMGRPRPTNKEQMRQYAPKTQLSTTSQQAAETNVSSSDAALATKDKKSKWAIWK